jgi:hypothetical protein
MEKGYARAVVASEFDEDWNWYLSSKAHSTAKCNGEIFGVEENLARSSVAEYLSGARVEFILDPLDIGI